MKRNRNNILLFTALALAGWLIGCAGDPIVHIVVPPTPDQVKKNPILGNGEACNGGCSLAKHDIDPFTDADFHNTMEDYAAAVVDEAALPLEKLIFYGSRTQELLDKFGTDPLPAKHVAFLKRELGRQHALVSFRLLEADGSVRVSFNDAKVRLGKKEHLHPTQLGSLQPFEVSGTALRVGLGHIWARY